MTILFLDLETTGLYANRHGVHQIGACIDIDGKVVDEFCMNVKPFITAVFMEEALRVSGITINEIAKYPDMEEAYTAFMNFKEKYAPSAAGKIFISGYNSGGLEMPFFREWFRHLGKIELFKSMFHSASLDVMVLAAQYSVQKNYPLVSYSLRDVAEMFSIPIDKKKLHNALYDAKLSREVYYKLIG